MTNKQQAAHLNQLVFSLLIIFLHLTHFGHILGHVKGTRSISYHLTRKTEGTDMHTEGWDPSILSHDQCALKCVTGKGAVVPLDSRVKIATAIPHLKVVEVGCCFQRRHHKSLFLKPPVLKGAIWTILPREPETFKPSLFNPLDLLQTSSFPEKVICRFCRLC